MGPSKPPNKAERAWMAWIVEFGCIACYLDGHMAEPCAVHHLVSGGRRMGHLFSIGLCDPGHHQNGKARGMVSIHPGRNPAFEAKYGKEIDLLTLLQDRKNGKAD